MLSNETASYLGPALPLQPQQVSGRALARTQARRRVCERRQEPDVRSLEPDLNLVAIRIGHVRVGKPWSKLASPEQPASRALDFRNRVVDVVRVYEPKTEMRHAANCRRPCWGPPRTFTMSCLPGACVWTRPSPRPYYTETKDLLVEPQRTRGVSNRKIDMREAVSPDHRNL